MSTPAKPLPRFQRTSRTQGANEVVRPLPPILLRLAVETEEAKRHANLAERFGQARTKLVALGTALEEAKRVDLAEERAAAETGRKRKVPKVPKVEQEIEEARREVEVLAELVEESAVELLRACVAFLPEADKQARAAVEAALTEARDSLLAAQARFEEAAKLAAEQTWVAGLIRDGQVPPWTAGRAGHLTPRARQLVNEALVAYEDDRRVAAERLEHTRREREVDEKLKLPPGTPVWREGESFRVAEDGKTLTPVEREEP